MPVSLNLTPSTIGTGDYPTAQTPILGGEMQVYLSTKPSRLLGRALLVADGNAGLQWKYVGLPSSNSDVVRGPIVAVAAGGGVLQVAADTVTYAGLTGQFTPSLWSSNQTFNFPVGRGVELIGTYVAPTSSSVPTISLAAGSGMLSGSSFEIVELPRLTDFVLAGCTTDRNVKLPSRGTKNIACGMREAEWTTPGIEKTGMLDVTGLNQGFDDGLMRFSGVKCQAMLVPLRENRLVTGRIILLDWVGECETPFPSGETEATVKLSGSSNRAVIIPAP